MSEVKRVREFAIKNGYETIKPLPDWKGLATYEPIYNSKSECDFIGLPLFIIVEKDGGIRMSTADEALERIE